MYTLLDVALNGDIALEFHHPTTPESTLVGSYISNCISLIKNVIAK